MREMKDSGVAWIGEIPKEWEIKRIKNIFTIIGGNGFPEKMQGKTEGDFPFCKVSDINGSSDYVSTAHNYVDQKEVDENSFNVIPVNSIIFAKIGAALQKNHRKVNTVPCCIDNNTEALVPYDASEICFLLLLLKTIDMGWFDNKSTIPSVNNTRLLAFQVPYPPLAEQGRIAEVLDAACSKVDALIANQSAQIEKLRAYKQSLITETVTKGLDPEAPMKHSGNDYIGDIPAYWSAIKVKYICNMQAGKNLTSEQIAEAGAYPVYGGNGIRGYFSEYNYDGACLLVGRQGALCGNVHYVSGKFWATEHAVITEPKADIELRYLFYLLTGANLNLYVSPTAAQPGLSVSTVQNILLCLAPKDEQSAIADYLDAQCAKIDALIALKQQKIDRLGQYKKSLIYEYVTGKKEA